MNKPSSDIKVQLFLAVKELATGPDDIKKRLDFACFYFYGIRIEDFLEDWKSSLSFFTVENVHGIDIPKWDALDRMDAETCVDFPKRIYTLM